MMFLHKNDRELLRDIIVTVSEKTGLEENIVEKDYYVTMILRELAYRNSEIVFKGGTSLSKAYHVIDRFSEDIDITFGEHIGEAKRKKLKYQLMKPVSEILELPIDNWDHIESDKDYNHYDFSYISVNPENMNGLRPYIKLETALMSYAYPTETKEITSIIYDCLAGKETEIIQEYGLEPFKMRTQTLSRTFIDKLFAACDYYMTGRPVRNSRHLYDLYKLKDQIIIDEKFRLLVDDVRNQRAHMDVRIAPSARENIDVLEVAKELVHENFYEKDYNDSTLKLVTDDLAYETVRDNFLDIMEKVF